MYRVITKYLGRRRNWVVEYGPWHPSLQDAENWAEILRSVGYNSEVQSQHGVVQHHGDHALRDALASMA